ncbi:MAG: hypothetical protein AAFY41_11205 [Bacteroidota bacterium]
MKYLTIITLLFSGLLNAQTNFKSLQTFNDNSLHFRMDHFSTTDLQSLKINIPDQLLINQLNYQSNLKLFSPQQYYLTNYPMNDLSNMDDLLMGTSLSNTLQLGKRSIQTTYIFDISGNLKSTETSFQLGKKKK